MKRRMKQWIAVMMAMVLFISCGMSSLAASVEAGGVEDAAVEAYGALDQENEEFLVSFDAGGIGAFLPEVQIVAANGLAADPGSLEADGYTFTGWYRDADCSILWDFAVDTVAEDTILYAGWEVNIPEEEETDPVIAGGDEAGQDIYSDEEAVSYEGEGAVSQKEDPALTAGEETGSAEEVSQPVKGRQYSVPRVTAYDTTSSVQQTLDTFIGCIGKFLSSVPSKDMEGAMRVWTRIGGIASGISGIAGGCISILQMTGIIEDPTAKTLASILTEIGNVQEKLQLMDQKLDEISGQLIELASSVDEKDRQSNARLLVQNWTKFNKDYIEAMDDFIEKYKGYIRKGVQDWWAKDHSKESDVYLLYTILEDNTVALTFSNAEGIPDTADNGETIEKSLCIGIPAECMPATTNFNVNTYKSDFIKLASAAISDAADQDKLIASDAFKAEWKSLSDSGKKEKADAYAEDLFSTILSKISCDVMTEHDQFVIDVRNAYTNYCSNILKNDTGIDALLHVLFLTHCFEGEVKQDIEDYCDGMIVSATVYGQFAIGCAAQSRLQTTEDRQSLQKKWTETVEGLAKKKKANITGKDNYCYLTSSILDYKASKVKSTATVYWHINWNGLAYEKCESSGWSIEGGTPSILNDEYSTVLYHYYLAQKTGDETFVGFLSKNGVNIPSSFKGSLVTNYKGKQNFALSDGLEMTCKAIDTPNASLGYYFTDGKKYKINKGNSSKVDGSCFVLHDKVLCNTMTLSGSLKTNQFWGARAVYGETHKKWSTDEAHVFYSGVDCTQSVEQNGKDADYQKSIFTFSSPIQFLVVSPFTQAVLPGGSTGPTALTEFKDKYELKTTEDKVKEAQALTVSGFKAKAKKKGKALVSWSANSKASGYVIQYGLKKSMKGTKSVKITNAKTKKKVLKKLKAKKKYYVRMRTLTNVMNAATGETTAAYGKWTSIKAFKAKK